MKGFSAQYIMTNNGPPLKRAVIYAEDDGTIVNIDDTGGRLTDKHSIEFYNGIIIPGFVNCHCHLELSHMKGLVPKGSGLGDFLEDIRSTREAGVENIISSATTADNDMYHNGVVLCADICNTASTFNIKINSRIKYINFLEVFGIDPEKAERRLSEIMQVAEKADELNLPFSLVPHSVYSMSVTLMKLLRDRCERNKVTSVHFMETAGEKSFLEDHTGFIMTSYKQSGLIPGSLETVSSHVDAVLNEITLSGNLILVHNTYVDRVTIRDIKERVRLFWCLCPNSNLYIEDKIPPVPLLTEEDCEIVIGTDSLASNDNLSILEELKTLQHYYPYLSLAELVRWGTYNGARALGEEEIFGKLETGKKPGLLLLQNVDLVNMKLLPDSFVTRLI
jgi:cytosine/adenosine deaminase-related metal-dependent hydrolase